MNQPNRNDRTPISAPPVVLVVEDEPDQLELLTVHFRRSGCTVIGVADAENALQLSADLAPDLMVLDLNLPGMDGWELTSRLRGRYPLCPVAITSVLDVQDYPDADWFLPKPVTKAHVKSVVAELPQRISR